jgi:hypothetical protein
MKQNKKIKQYIRLIKKDRDFDYAYLLILERHKLLRMIDSFTNATHPYVGIEYHIRDMKLCVELINIILEEDKITFKSLNLLLQTFLIFKYLLSTTSLNKYFDVFSIDCPQTGLTKKDKSIKLN